MFLLAGVWAAVCKQFGTFWMCFAGTGALLALFAVIFNQVSSRIDGLPFPQTTGEVTATGVGQLVLSRQPDSNNEIPRRP